MKFECPFNLFAVFSIITIFALCVGAAEQSGEKMSDDSRSKTTRISKQKAIQMANEYLKSKNINWGPPTSAAMVDRGSSILVKGEDSRLHEESWEWCYYVQYETPHKERALTGIRTVIVSGDGLKVAIPTSE